MIRCNLDVPNVYDNHHILTVALEGLQVQDHNCSVTVREDANSPDWLFTIRLAAGGCIRAIWPTSARMESPRRQIAGIKAGLDKILSQVATCKE
jgi:hypothetical protein